MTAPTPPHDPRPAPAHPDRRRLVEVLVMGFVGAIMMVVWGWGSPHPGMPKQVRPVGVAVAASGVVGLSAMVIAWLRSRKLVGARILTLVTWSLPLLFGPPLLSQDGWAYAAQGWVLAQGLDPYSVPQGAAGVLGQAVDAPWRGTTAVYPPGSLWIQAAMVTIAHADPLWSVLLMRVPAIVGVALMVWAVPRLARHAGTDPDGALWLAVCCPLTTLNIIGGMHNDGLQVGLSLAALVVAHRLAVSGRGWLGLVVGGAIVGLAGTIKQPGVLAGVGVVALVHVDAVRHGGHRWVTRHCWSGLLARTAVGAVSALAVFGAISAIGGLGLGWLNPTAGSPVAVTSDSPIALVVQILRGSGGIPLDKLVGPATIVSLVLTLVAMVWCWARWGPVPPMRSRDDSVGQLGNPLRLQAGVMIAFAVLGASLQSWYLIGPLALVSSIHLRRTHRDVVIAAVVAVVILTYLQWYWSPYVCLPLVIVGYLIVWRIPKAWAFVTATT
ncbi:polyprenol phosphomannose-dependent alpha 1,6 mannosyltransferase MptB [Cutibacterium equinum]|uniref:Polyprenol phosphomannose-dependent alpha 1,6 mannosyltransferase MptB n=1 Tax=Cutibacterium equinum TaxID=3016342 RepID=A0ABY7QWL8_9ACTN|nr:polyprenol phosphomannose-dependent alpha 1,6 mannosyltransferase MptB [Cutibacterium equinum]WCC79463.1 polyprenol phosphomannose-dependent alpha 1,6 mannosyltransferase MptB [Cutibacterium equinum]